MTTKVLLSICLLVLFCRIPLAAQNSPADFPEGKEGLVKLAKYLATSDMDDREKMSLLLWPDPTDYTLVFEDEIISRMKKYHAHVRRNYRILVQPMIRTQLEVRVWEADRDQIIQHEGDAAFFAGGYVELAPMIKPGMVLYRLKYAEPDRYLGSTYDLFVYLHGQWIFFPRPYQVLQKGH